MTAHEHQTNTHAPLHTYRVYDVFVIHRYHATFEQCDSERGEKLLASPDTLFYGECVHESVSKRV
jgi:hypothetical protein